MGLFPLKVEMMVCCKCGRELEPVTLGREGKLMFCCPNCKTCILVVGGPLAQIGKDVEKIEILTRGGEKIEIITKGDC